MQTLHLLHDSNKIAIQVENDCTTSLVRLLIIMRLWSRGKNYMYTVIAKLTIDPTRGSGSLVSSCTFSMAATTGMLSDTTPFLSRRASTRENCAPHLVSPIYNWSQSKCKFCQEPPNITDRGHIPRPIGFRRVQFIYASQMPTLFIKQRLK